MAEHQPAPGFYHHVDDASLVAGIVRAIDEKQRFTQVVPESVVRRGVDIVLLSLEWDRIDFAGLCERQHGKATAQQKVQIDTLVPLGITVEQLSPHLRVIPIEHEELVLPMRPTRFNKEEWDDLWQAILAVCTEDQRQGLQHLVSVRDARLQRTVIESRGLFLERDAVGAALQIAGFDRDTILRSIAHPTVPPRSFVELLKYVHIEDVFITHDQVNLPGFIRREWVAGECTLENEQTCLTVIHAHRTALESATGGDLIYYNDRYNAYTIVQYKMMEHVRGAVWQFRPNGQSYERELAQMRAARELSRTNQRPPSAELEYRFNRDPFFIKLCDRSRDKLRGGELASGLYIALEHWDIALNDPCTSGPKGGKVVGYDSPGRHFSNSDFTTLVAKGWIGTALRDASLETFVEELLEQGHAVTTAISETRGRSRSRRR